MRELIKLTVILTLFSIIAATAIVVTYSFTKSKIQMQEQLNTQKALESVFPEGTTIEQQKGTPPLPPVFWVGKKNGEVYAYAFRIESKGYSGIISAFVSVDTSGSILNLKIISQTETPGLGTRIEETISKNTIWTAFFKKQQPEEPWFCAQFKNISVLKPIGIDKMGEWHALDDRKRQELLRRNSISAVTGATITTKAITSALEKNVAAYFAALKGMP